MKVIVDAFGGDNAPSEIIKGAVEALKQSSDLKVVLSGKNDVILKELENSNSLTQLEWFFISIFNRLIQRIL